MERCIFALDALKFLAYSPLIAKQCDQLWFISDYESAQYVQRNPRHAAKALFVPTRVELSSMCPFQGVGGNVLYIGALTRAMNREGLEWYLTNVHPALCQTEGYSLTIAGYTNGEPIDYLMEFAEKYSNIAVVPDAQDLALLYAGSSVFINPIFAGAGVKLKTLGAMEAGLPVVTTGIGVEGTGLTPGTGVLIADSPNEFRANVQKLLCNSELCAQIVAKGQEFLLNVYDQERRIAEALSGIERARPISVDLGRASKQT